METSHQLFKIVEDGEIFDPIGSINQGGEHGKWMSFEHLFDTDDGIFPRVSDWTRFVNRIENDGVTEYLTWISKNNKLKIDSGYCTIIRKGKWDNEATLYFDKPIEIEFGEINGDPITGKANVIHGEFSYEWGWWKNGRQNKMANSVEIFFDCQKFELIEK